MKKGIAVILAFVMLICVSACAGRESGASQSLGAGSASVDTQPADGKVSSTVGLSNNITALDPISASDIYSANVYGCIYETLMREEENGEVVPNLCESVDISEDGLTYTFHLPQGVKFHNGEELRASDVAFSLNRALGTTVDYLVSSISEATALDDYTVEVKLLSPTGSFLANLTTPQTGILNEKAVTEGGDEYQLHPVGTGALRFVSWTPGVSCVLEKNDEYHGEPAAFDELIFKTIVEDASRTIALESGDVDIALAIPATDVERVRGGDGLQLYEGPTRAVNFIGFNCAEEPFNDVRVREAIALAIDTEALTQAVKLGYAEVATSILNTNVAYADKTIPVNEFNLEKARELLAEAGYPDGFSTTIWSKNSTELTSVNTIIKEMLAQINVDVEINTLEWATFLDACSKGEVDMYAIAWKCATPDPDRQFYQTLHSSMIGTWNFSQIDDATVDELIETGRVSTDSSVRAEAYSELQQYMFEQKFWIPMWQDIDYIGMNSRIASIDVDPSGAHRWVNTQLNG